MRRIPPALLLFALLGCSPAQNVEVRTRVGPEAGPAEDAALALRVARVMWDRDGPPSAADAARRVVVAPPQDFSQLWASFQAIREDPVEDIAVPARNLAQAGPSAWIPIRAALLGPRRHPKGEYRSVLAVIGGDVPNRYGYFDLAWKRAHGHQVRLSEDWFEDLLAMPLVKVAPAMRDVYRDCVLQTALLRAAARIGREHPPLTGDVVATLLEAAYVHQGTFRDEVGRALVSIGDEAVPHLVRAAILPGIRSRKDEESLGVRKAQYAEHTLDRMDRLVPSRAIAAVRDTTRILVALLEAYEVAKTGEAAPHLLELVDAASPRVRESARAAFLAYVTGPAPTIGKKTLRLLGGGTVTRASHVSYRGLALRAIRDELARHDPALLEPECELRRPDGEPDAACEAQAERLTHAWLAALDTARAAREEAQVREALADPRPRQGIERIDRLLAAGARIDRPERLLPLLTAAADRARDDGEPERAAQLLRKSAMLVSTTDAAAADLLRARALVLEASVSGLPTTGRAMLLDSALELADGDASVREAVEDLRAAQAFADDPGIEPRLWRGIGLLAAALLALTAAGSTLRRRLYRSRSEG
jgi:hypothetical protein